MGKSYRERFRDEQVRLERYQANVSASLGIGRYNDEKKTGTTFIDAKAVILTPRMDELTSSIIPNVDASATVELPTQRPRPSPAGIPSCCMDDIHATGSMNPNSPYDTRELYRWNCYIGVWEPVDTIGPHRMMGRPLSMKRFPIPMLRYGGGR